MAKKSKTPKPKTKAKNSKSKVASKKTVRKVKVARYKSFKLAKKIKHDKVNLKPARKIFTNSIKHLITHKGLFTRLLLIAIVLNVLFVKGFTSVTNVGELKELLQSFTAEPSNQIYQGLTIFTLLLGSSGSGTTEAGAIYQYILVVILSLAYIWALRRTFLPKPATTKAKDAFYQGMYPLIPFVIVIFVIGLQLIPIVVAAFIYQTVIAGGLVANNLEASIWLLLTALMALLSLYMVTSSVFALYIATLPKTPPLQALRSARGLVLHRRWTVMRKFLFLPFVFMIISAIVVIPIIIFAPWFAEWALYILGVIGLLVGHSYMYYIYRELL